MQSTLTFDRRQWLRAAGTAVAGFALSSRVALRGEPVPLPGRPPSAALEGGSAEVPPGGQTDWFACRLDERHRDGID